MPTCPQAQKDRHHHRGGHAAHRLRLQVPQHALRRQEPQAPRPDPGLLAAPTACSTTPSPTATSSTSASSRTPSMPPSPSSPARSDRPGPRNLAGGQGPRRHREAAKTPCSKLDDLHEVAGPDLRAGSTWPTSRATTPAPPSSSTSRKCSGSRPSSTNTPTSPRTTKQAIEQTPARRQPARLPRRLSGNRPAPQSAARQRRRQASRDSGPARFRVRPLRLRRHRLRLHHGADRQLHAKTRQAEDEPRATHRPHQSDAKFMDERDDITAYINTLKAGEGLSEKAIRDGYQAFKADKAAKELADIADKHGLQPPSPASLRGWHPEPHDLRWRTTQRPACTARTGLESP